jgi:lipoyl-dependent peroxiredoxin
MDLMITQTASVRWERSIARGRGELSSASHALDGLEVDLPNRVGERRTKTSPEEMLAAAHATCFAMALGSILAEARRPPELLEVTAHVHLDPAEGKRRITAIDLEVTGRVPDADEPAFGDVVQQAEQRCLISRALEKSITISAHPTLLTAT